ncbi:MAG TPA: hypothetical protein VFT16_01635 [Candidatus Saccharimonadales bacterium]|nr:hypothetical protein [Candidatus Saccharimonadales bacterium]
MSPQQDQSPGLRLPQPSFDTGQVPVGMPQAFAAARTSMPPIMPAAQPAPQFESLNATSQAQSQPQPAAQPAGAISMPPATMPGQPLATASAQEASTVPTEDDSTIDQEWVVRAKEIVGRTHSDPYLQSKEISKIKAQYIKVRYNKDIKTVEE